MPIYEYECPKCDKVLETLVLASDGMAPYFICPKCCEEMRPPARRRVRNILVE